MSNLTYSAIPSVLEFVEKLVNSNAKISIFIQRLAWVPLDYPLNYGPLGEIEAERLLCETLESNQVLIGYFASPSSLVSYLRHWYVSLADLLIFDANSNSLICQLVEYESQTFLGRLPSWKYGEMLEDSPEVLHSGSIDRGNALMYLGAEGSIVRLSTAGRVVAKPLELIDIGEQLVENELSGSQDNPNDDELTRYGFSSFLKNPDEGFVEFKKCDLHNIAVIGPDVTRGSYSIVLDPHGKLILWVLRRQNSNSVEKFISFK